MEQGFWQEKWDEGRIGFNQTAANPYLTAHWGSLGLAPGSRILVPLCGKTIDMLWLRAQGHAVVGVEFVKEACEAFFIENDIPFEATAMGYRATDDGPELTLVYGDFMALQPEQMGLFDGFYDRASVVALSKDLQEAMAAQMDRLIPSGGRGLMVTFEFPSPSGPPFSTPEARIEDLFGGHFDLKLLASHDAPEEDLEKFGVEWARELAMALTKN